MISGKLFLQWILEWFYYLDLSKNTRLIDWLIADSAPGTSCMNDSFVVVYRTRRNQYDAAGALARSRRSRSVLPRGYTDPPTNRDRHMCSPQYSAHLVVRSKIVLNVPNDRVYCCSLNATVGRGMSNAIRLSIWLNSTSSVVLGAEERDVSAATHLLCLLRLSRCR